MSLLITGGAGFIGSNYVLSRAEKSDERLVVIDSLTYAGNLENLSALFGRSNFRFARADVTDEDAIDRVFEEEQPKAVVHFAAESHVDRSILGPKVFTNTNVLGTQVLLEAARRYQVRRFLLVSTDEVYGDLGREGQFLETSPLAPSSPYSASKAAADLLALAYQKTFGLDVVITRSSNNYGPLQFPEKLIPLMILNALEDKPLPIYGDGQQVRDWIHVLDHCAAIDLVLDRGRPGQVYNVGARSERTNLEIVERILAHLEKPASLIRHVRDRPGHDRRYAIDPSKIEAELGFFPSQNFDRALLETIEWYRGHRSWWEHVRSGAYRDYYERQYAARLRAASAQMELR